MAAFAPALSQLWTDGPEEAPRPEAEPAPVDDTPDCDDLLLRELVERVNAARTVV